MIKTLLSAASFLSQHGQVHGAIKPSNIFATKEVFKIADPNTFFEPTPPGQEEAIHFTAPEILMGGDPNHESDLYSIGAVMHRILTGRHIFDDSDPSRLKWKYLSAAPQPTSYVSALSNPISQQLLNLVSRNPDDREPALERLKRILGFETVKPSRALFIGRTPILQQLVADAKVGP